MRRRLPDFSVARREFRLNNCRTIDYIFLNCMKVGVIRLVILKVHDDVP